MSSLIRFDSSLPTPAPATFGLGLLPTARSPRPRDEHGNRIPQMPYDDADEAWHALEMAAREAGGWDAWTDEMDAASLLSADVHPSLWPDWTDRVRIEADDLASEAEAMRLDAMEREWLASLDLPAARERDDMPAGYFS